MSHGKLVSEKRTCNTCRCWRAQKRLEVYGNSNLRHILRAIPRLPPSIAAARSQRTSVGKAAFSTFDKTSLGVDQMNCVLGFCKISNCCTCHHAVNAFPNRENSIQILPHVKRKIRPRALG